MHPILRKFFETHRETTAAHRDASHKTIGEIQKLGRGVQQHLHDLEEQLHEAELEVHDARITPLLQYMHTRIEQGHIAIRTYLGAGRELARVLDSLEDGLTQKTLDLVAVMASTEEEILIDRVTMPITDHQALLKRADTAEAELARLKAK